MTRPLRLLVLARNYPNPALPLLGLWTQRLTHCATSFAEVKVVSPVPHAPPLPSVGPLAYYTRTRAVPRRRWDGPVEVLHPRMLIGPGYSTHELETISYALAALPAVRRLRRRFPFDLIHAHFTYPDGVVAAMLGRIHRVPVVISEHVPWLSWMARRSSASLQARWAARACAAHVPVSGYVARTIGDVLGSAHCAVEPISPLVDGELFRPDGDRRPDQVLFVGAIRRVKGADVLVDALAALRRRRPAVRLLLAGEPYYRSYRREAEAILERARAGGVADRIELLGGRSPRQVAALMAQSAVLAVPSRAESFSAVAIEALACGTPVVATRCGGPEEIIAPAVGRLVPTEDSHALADALAAVLERPGEYDPALLRSYALERYGREAVTRRLATRYEAVRYEHARRSA